MIPIYDPEDGPLEYIGGIIALVLAAYGAYWLLMGTLNQ